MSWPNLFFVVRWLYIEDGRVVNEGNAPLPLVLILYLVVSTVDFMIAVTGVDTSNNEFKIEAKDNS